MHTRAWMTIWGARNVRSTIVYAKMLSGARKILKPWNTQTVRQQQLTNCLSMFDHSVGLLLIVLKQKQSLIDALISSDFVNLSNKFFLKQPPGLFFKKCCSQKFCNIHRCFPVNTAKFLRKFILKNICKRLLLFLGDFLVQNKLVSPLGFGKWTHKIFPEIVRASFSKIYQKSNFE